MRFGDHGTALAAGQMTSKVAGRVFRGASMRMPSALIVFVASLPATAAFRPSALDAQSPGASPLRPHLEQGSGAAASPTFSAPFSRSVDAADAAGGAVVASIAKPATESKRAAEAAALPSGLETLPWHAAFNHTEEAVTHDKVGSVLKGLPRDKWQQLLAFEQRLYPALADIPAGGVCPRTGRYAHYGCALHKADGSPACVCDGMGWLTECYQESDEKVSRMLDSGIVGEALFISRSMIAGRCHFKPELYYVVPAIPFVLTAFFFVAVSCMGPVAEKIAGAKTAAGAKAASKAALR